MLFEVCLHYQAYYVPKLQVRYVNPTVGFMGLSHGMNHTNSEPEIAQRMLAITLRSIQSHVFDDRSMDTNKVLREYSMLGPHRYIPCFIVGGFFGNHDPSLQL